MPVCSDPDLSNAFRSTLSKYLQTFCPQFHIINLLIANRTSMDPKKVRNMVTLSVSPPLALPRFPTPVKHPAVSTVR